MPYDSLTEEQKQEYNFLNKIDRTARLGNQVAQGDGVIQSRDLKKEIEEERRKREKEIQSSKKKFEVDFKKLIENQEKDKKYAEKVYTDNEKSNLVKNFEMIKELTKYDNFNQVNPDSGVISKLSLAINDLKVNNKVYLNKIEEKKLLLENEKENYKNQIKNLEEKIINTKDSKELKKLKEQLLLYKSQLSNTNILLNLLPNAVNNLKTIQNLDIKEVGATAAGSLCYVTAGFLADVYTGKRKTEDFGAFYTESILNGSIENLYFGALDNSSLKTFALNSVGESLYNPITENQKREILSSNSNVARVWLDTSYSAAKPGRGTHYLLAVKNKEGKWVLMDHTSTDSSRRYDENSVDKDKALLEKHFKNIYRIDIIE
jgi:hypothetical protein